MVIDNFNILGIALDPDKTDPPLIVNSYAVLALPPSFQGLKAVGGWDFQIP